MTPRALLLAFYMGGLVCMLALVLLGDGPFAKRHARTIALCVALWPFFLVMLAAMPPKKSEDTTP